MQVRVKRIDKSLPLPAYKTEGAAGFDLYSRIDAEIPAGESMLLPTNFVIDFPKDFALKVYIRSSAATKRNLTKRNAVAIIDSDYCGDDDELFVFLYNFGKESQFIKKGERVAQAVFTKIEQATFTEVDSMDNENRGGFGTTGTL